MKNIVLDGQFYAQRMTGQYRYANEILKQFDKIVEPNKYTLVVPNCVKEDQMPVFNNIVVERTGNVKGILWTQTSLLLYLVRNKAISVGFCNITPLLRRGITVVHDVGYKDLSTHYKNLYGRLSSLWHRLNYWMIAKSNKPIITVSQFSKKRIESVYHVKGERISVIGCGWQQYDEIMEDDNVYTEFPQIRKNQYYFAVGSLEERKNFKWIVEVAKRHPEEQFVIAGGAVKNATKTMDFGGVKNLVFVGFVPDSYVKSLMKHCKCFLFSSTYEGFGIPPLEALSVGAKVMCAKCASVPEICGEAVRYFEPDDYNIDINILLHKPVSDPEETLQRHSWIKSAQKLQELLEKESR